MSRSNIDGAAKLRSSVVWYTALIWYDTLAYVFMCCYMDSIYRVFAGNLQKPN